MLDAADLPAAIASVQPKRRAARLRPIMPMLYERHRAGVTYAELAEALGEQGITISGRMLQIYMLRWRHKRGDADTASEATTASEPALVSGYQPRSGPTSPGNPPSGGSSAVKPINNLADLRQGLSSPKMTPDEARQARERARQSFKSDQKGD